MKPVSPYEVSEVDADTWKALGYVIIAGPYTAKEGWMAKRVMADLLAGHIPCVLVRGGKGVEVWRRKIGMRLWKNGRTQEVTA